MPLSQTAETLGIDLAGLATMIFLWRREAAADERSMAMISREERLGELQVELSSGKLAKMKDLREMCRPVIVAGSAEDVVAALEEAESADMRAGLESKSVLVVPMVLAADGSGRPGPQIEAGGDENLRWRVTPILAERWADWVTEQMRMAKVAEGRPVWLSLRADGRIRASGVGAAPWARMAAELAPMDSKLAGFDGSMSGPFV